MNGFLATVRSVPEGARLGLARAPDHHKLLTDPRGDRIDCPAIKRELAN